VWIVFLFQTGESHWRRNIELTLHQREGDVQGFRKAEMMSRMNSVRTRGIQLADMMGGFDKGDDKWSYFLV
jgi:hypothetical protein